MNNWKGSKLLNFNVQRQRHFAIACCMLGGIVGLHRWCLPGDPLGKMSFTALGVFAIVYVNSPGGTIFNIPLLVCCVWMIVDLITLIVCDDEAILEGF